MLLLRPRHGGTGRPCRGAHASRVVVLASRQNELCLWRQGYSLGSRNSEHRTKGKVREGETPAPARERRALPRARWHAIPSRSQSPDWERN